MSKYRILVEPGKDYNPEFPPPEDEIQEFPEEEEQRFPEED